MGLSSGKPKVFVSYSTKDDAFAKRLVADLTKAGLPIWFAEQDLHPGDSIIKKIGDALASTDYLLVLLSKSSVSATWVQLELNTFLARELTQEKRFDLVIPVVIEDCEMPPLLLQNLYVDFRGSADPASYQQALNRLIDIFTEEATDNAPSGLRIYTATERVRPCEELLQDLTGAELRRRMASSMSREDIDVVWFDVFEERMSDDLPLATKEKCIIEMILRAKERKRFPVLLREVCARRPSMGESG